MGVEKLSPKARKRLLNREARHEGKIIARQWRQAAVDEMHLTAEVRRRRRIVVGVNPLTNQRFESPAAHGAEVRKLGKLTHEELLLYAAIVRALPVLYPNHAVRGGGIKALAA